MPARDCSHTPSTLIANAVPLDQWIAFDRTILVKRTRSGALLRLVPPQLKTM
jgi:hypothetical protein